MASFVKYYCFVEDIGEEVHDLENDTLKIALTNTAPTVATDDERADITEIAAGNGYTLGGETVGSTTWTQATGTATLAGDDVTFTAAGGAIAQFRYAVLYNDSAANDELIAYWDYGSAVNLAVGESFKVDLGASIVTLA